MLFLSKVLPLFVYPLGLALLLSATAALPVWLRWRRPAGLLAFLAFAELWVASTPAFANWIYGRLEAQHPITAVADLPASDVAILLGGFPGQPLPPPATPDLGEAADRALHAARIFAAGRVSHILVTGGNLPWTETAAPEAMLIRDFLVELGVPADATVVETASRNTRENAANSAVLMADEGWSTAILVTSAAHMTRALTAFEAEGVEAAPAPTDVRAAGPLATSLIDFLPDAHALAMTSDAVKEWVGVLAYRARGWA